MDLLKLLFDVLPYSFLAYLTYSICVAIYNITFHPLAKFPGPKLWAAFHFPQYWQIYIGNNTAVIKALHDKYGEVVRISPRALSFNTGQAWRDIYAHKKGRAELEKDPEAIVRFPGTTPHMIEADTNTHNRMRKLLSHAFSDSALREQEPLIQSYCDLLITKLHERVDGHMKGHLDLVSWFNFMTFDIVGDLGYGESFHALERSEPHPWVTDIFQSLKVATMLRPIANYTLSRTIVFTLVAAVPFLAKAKKDHDAYTLTKTTQRFEQQTDRKDFMSHVLRHNDERGMSFEEITANGEVIIIGGSETTATLMSGLVFHLLKSPDILEKLNKEVRDAFQSPSQMTFAAEAKLRYLQACLDEALRIYPPVPSMLSRLTEPEGNVISGHFVPGNYSVGVHHLSASLSARNFKDPDKFVPGRWLGDERYADDDRSATQPFSMGVRGCLGKTLAYAEMRSTMVRMLWNFDMELCEDSMNWMDQKVYILWDKSPLNVKLSARKH